MEDLEWPQTETTAHDTPVLIVSFPLQGKYLPADHGFALYSAITQRLPGLHGVDWLGIELINGIPWDKGVVALRTRGATLRLRLPGGPAFPGVLPLAGAHLHLEGHSIRLGIPVARPLTPASSLYARIVSIKPFTDLEPFLAAAQRQLVQLGIAGVLEPPRDGQTRSRRIITIHGRKIVGFSLAAHGLSDADSIKLQTQGIGGRRSMGCGLFNPIAGAVES